MPNAYCTLAEVKNELGETSTDATRDAILLTMIEQASRHVDSACGRSFFVSLATRYFDVIDPCKLIIDDCLSISAFTADSEGDGTFDGTTFTQGDTEDYILWPYNEWPKMYVVPAANPTYWLSCGKRYAKIVGQWGYGTGLTATPYSSTGLTGTLSDADDTTITASADASTAVYVGQTLLIESEQVYVTAVATTTITVERGVNGTTAAAHAAATMYRYKYPAEITRETIDLAKSLYLARQRGAMQMEMIGQYQYQYSSPQVIEDQLRERLGRFVRIVA